MQEHLKIRLTGAIILVVMVVMLVPEMFRGQPASRLGHGEAALGELPVHRVNIDLRNELAPPSAATPSVGAAGTQGAASPGAAVVSAPLDPAIASTQLPVQAPVSALTLPPAASAASLARPAGRWVVQAGTFSRRDFAERMVKQLHAKGFAAVVAGPDDRGLYRVRSPIMSSRASADALRQKMSQKGLKPIVNAAP